MEDYKCSTTSTAFIPKVSKNSAILGLLSLIILGMSTGGGILRQGLLFLETLRTQPVLWRSHQLDEFCFNFSTPTLGKLCGCPQLFRPIGSYLPLCEKPNIDSSSLPLELRTFLIAHAATCECLHPLHAASGGSWAGLALCWSVARRGKLGSGTGCRSLFESGLVPASSDILLRCTQRRFWKKKWEHFFTWV